MPTTHLTYGGSTAARTLSCGGWVEKSKNIPRRPAGSAALEGSMHHQIMELCQKTDAMPVDHLGHVYKENGVELVFTEDDLDLSEIAYHKTNELLEDLDIDQMMIEPFVQLIEGVAGGSIDLLGLSTDEKTLLILDYKFGSVKVSPIESEQAGVYGISAKVDPSTADLFKKVKKVVVAIIQPKIKGVTFTWDTDLAWLDKFETTFRAAMDSKKLVAGAHCKYCPAEPYCEVKRASVMAATLLGSEDRDKLQAAAEVVLEVESWVKSMKEEMYLQLNRGVPITGWKIVAKRATRKWIESAAGDKVFKQIEGAHKTTLITPAQMEKLIKKNNVDVDITEFIMTECSGTTLATDDDSREAVIVSDITGHLKEMMK